MKILILGKQLFSKINTMPMVKASCSVIDAVDALADATEALLGASYGVILISACAPDGSGIEWLKERRQKELAAPVVFLTHQDSADERITAFEAGADDCIKLPVTDREMIARLRAVSRRPGVVAPSVLIAGNTRLDSVSREIWVSGIRLRFPRREVSLLEQLMRRVDRVAPRTLIEANIYGIAEEVAPNSIEVGISRIRRRLAEANATVSIQTVRGIGYCLCSTSPQR